MANKVQYLFLILLVFGCSPENDTKETEILNVFGGYTNEINQIVFPEAPIEIMNNKELRMAYINYFNIVQVSPSKFYLYFAAFPDRTKGGEFDQNLYLATSEDGFKYTVLKDNWGAKILMSAVKEQSVLYTPNDKTKFKLIGNISEDGIEKLCVWESVDGIHFDKRNVVFANIPHDTQNVLIQRGDGYDLYTRLWLPDWNYRTNRKIAKCHLGPDFMPETDLQILPPDYMYTNAASKLDSKSDLLIPTWFNDLEGRRTQEIHIDTYICTNKLIRSVSNNLEEWLNPDSDRWIVVSPGIVSIGQYKYIAFQTKQKDHSFGISDSGVSKYMLIRIQVNY